MSASSLLVVICGTTIQLVTTFVDEDGAPADPTAVTGEVRKPDQTVAQLVVTRDDVGVYSAPFTPVQNGLHQYRFAGTGAVAAASEGSWLAETEFPTP